MSLTFTRAPRIKPGECITAQQWNRLAAAVNDRLCSGVGDPTWRIWWRASSIVRKICADRAHEHSAADEWWRWWIHAEPERALGCAAGENEIAPLAVWSRGIDAPFWLSPEEQRSPQPAPPGGSLHDYWVAAAEQRGAVTVDGAINAPALEAAAAVRRISYLPYVAPFLKGWGGFFPAPKCGAEAFEHDDFDRWLAWLAWERRCARAPESAQGYGAVWAYEPAIFEFSPVREGLPPLQFYPMPLRNYTYDSQRKCYEFDIDNDPNRNVFLRNVARVERGPHSYLLRHLDGSVTELSYRDYIEGPYARPARLQFSHASLLAEAMQWFADGWKGSLSQRASPAWDPLSVGWDWEAFFASQYSLAPAYGVREGGDVVAVYPRFAGAAPAPGELLELQEGGTGQVYQVHDGYCVAGWYAQAVALDGALDLLLEDADTGTVLARVRLSPKHNAALQYVAQPPTARRVRVRVGGDPRWQAGGTVHIELAELVRMQPNVADAYVVLRAMSTHGAAIDDVDAVGDRSTHAREMWERWAQYGCLVHTTTLPAQGDLSITQHPLHETVRQMFSEHMRMIDRVWITEPMLLSYEVGADGKSVFRFRRYGFLEGNRYDLWRGIAPEDAPVDRIERGLTYYVAGSTGAVYYDGATYTPGQTFMGADALTWARAGDAYPRRYDGIAREPPPAGETNEWVLFLSQHRAKDTGWCAHANYGDVLVLLSDRCTTFDRALDPLGSAPDLASHIGYNAGGVIAENPSGYRYVRSGKPDGAALNMPSAGTPVDFMRSCQIYPPDYLVESVTLEGEGDGQVVRVQLAGRLRRTENAPAIVPPDRALWPRDANGQLLDGNNQPPAYRTDENAVMEMLLYLHDGVPCRELVGDSSCNGNYTPGECWGACQTHFFFTRLVPRVYEETDHNETIEEWDTRAVARRLQWVHFALAAMCEGYIDLDAAQVTACPPAKLPDYTLRSLAAAVSGDELPRVMPHTDTAGSLTWDTVPGRTYAVQARLKTADPPRNTEWTTEAVLSFPPHQRQQTSTDYEYRVLELSYARQYLELLPGVEGFGPIANSCMRAAIIDQLAAALNKLHTVRLEVPLTLVAEQGVREEIRIWDAPAKYCAVDWPNPDSPLVIQRVGETTHLHPTELPTEWEPVEIPSAGAARYIVPWVSAQGYPHKDAHGNWLSTVTESVIRFRVAETAWLQAISPHIRDMVRTAPTVAVYGYYAWHWRDPAGDPWPCAGQQWGCTISSHAAGAPACVIAGPDGPHTVVRAPPITSGVLGLCAQPGIGGAGTGPASVITGLLSQADMMLTIPIG